VVLGGHTRVKNSHANFQNSFKGTTGNGYGLANALVKINFAYAGYTNAFNVAAEVKVKTLIHASTLTQLTQIQRPIRTIKRTGPASLLVVAILYILCNIAYFAAGSFSQPIFPFVSSKPFQPQCLKRLSKSLPSSRPLNFSKPSLETSTPLMLLVSSSPSPHTATSLV